MPKQPIKMTDLMTVELTGYGSHVLDEHLNRDMPRGNKPGEARTLRLQTHTLPLWELMRIFGPSIRSSLKIPIDSITFERPPSKYECSRSSDQPLRALLHALMPDISVYYKAPELLPGLVNGWLDERVPTEPTEPGLWWLGDEVVRVIENNGVLLATLGNHRRKPVTELDGWGGPACRDPRVKNPADDEDIPF